jgi:CRP-like cAMP-binding protein
VRRLLTGRLKPMTVQQGQILWEEGTSVEGLYFPIDAVFVVAAPVDNGSALEVHTVGPEGVVGIWGPMLGGPVPWRCVCILGGRVAYVDRGGFSELAANPVIAGFMKGIMRAALFSLTKSIVCNRFHSLLQRSAKLVLYMNDRSSGRTFPLTQEVWAQFVGCDRASLAVRAERLQSDGCITYRRGMVTVLDAKRLEGFACTCYRDIDGAFKAAIAGETVAGTA